MQNSKSTPHKLKQILKHFGVGAPDRLLSDAELISSKKWEWVCNYHI